MEYRYKCDVCGRALKKKISLYGHTLCSKHMHQLLKYGKFLDNIQRTTADLNDYVINPDKTVTFRLYNQKNVQIGSFIIDLDDIEKVKYHKWRLSSFNHVITGRPAEGNARDLSHVILGITKEDCKNGVVVDHINRNPLDNRKSNLRECVQGENVLNKSIMTNNTSGFTGVSYRKDRNAYDPEIRFQHKRCHLGYTKTLKEAVYKRMVAEIMCFRDFCNTDEIKKKKEFTKDLPINIKNKLMKQVIDKINKKVLGNQLCRSPKHEQ